jgi:hypothetical protein
LPLEQRTTGDVDFEAPSLSVAYSYAGGYSSGLNWSATTTANGVVSIVPPGLANGIFDLVTHRSSSPDWADARPSLWVANFASSYRRRSRYYFRLGIKEQKEVYVERGTRFGSFGGIQ